MQGHVLRTSYFLPVLYSYFNSSCISDVRRVELTFISRRNTTRNSQEADFLLINVRLFHILSAISCGKVGDFFCLESGNRDNSRPLIKSQCPNYHIGLLRLTRGQCSDETGGFAVAAGRVIV